MKARYHFWCYITAYLLVPTLLLIGSFTDGKKEVYYGIGFAILLFAFIVEAIAGRRPRRNHGVGREWIAIASLLVKSRVTIHDQLRPKALLKLDDVPDGRYKILVERFRKESEHCVAAFSLESMELLERRLIRSVDVNIETGFMFLLTRDSSPPINAVAARLEEEILEENGGEQFQKAMRL